MVVTDRLLLTPVGLEHVEELERLHREPQVDRWTGPWTPDGVRAWTQDMAERWSADGVGKWIAHDRRTGTVVGRGGLSRTVIDDETVLEVGWAVRDELTGRGYATEIGRAALRWAAAFLPGLPVVAFTEVHNLASRAVMRRLGLRPAGVLHREGLVAGRQGLQPDAPFALYRHEPGGRRGSPAGGAARDEERRPPP